jgi:CRP/FNR family cyclic AMP-dependent transcriptional regulator
MSEIIDRFTTANGERILRDALLKQPALQGIPAAVEELVGIVELRAFPPGATILTQDGSDNHIGFILTGAVSISINGRLINSRKAGQHIGEMSLIDSSARRSASVIAIEETVVGIVDEPTFSSIADRHPQIWRRLAIELGDRLRQRTKGIVVPNELPHIFIGSSKEALAVAREIKGGFPDDRFVVQIWEKETFLASDTTIESLEHGIGHADFAVLVLAPEDDVISREIAQRAPRDNVVFELGLFMGALGRRRTYIVSPAYAPMKIPTDLLGITPLYYSQDAGLELSERVAPICEAIRARVLALKPK